MKTLAPRGSWSMTMLTMLATMTAMLLLYAATALAAPVNEVEPNNTTAEAQNIDGSSFSLDSDPNIGNKTSNTSTTMPHATVNGTGDGTVDYYSFTVLQAGALGIFDVDGARPSFDSWIELYDSDGNRLAFNDDAPTAWGQGGSVSLLDSYLEHTFTSPGTYYIAVGRFPSLQPIPNGASYQLHVSLNHPTSAEQCKKGGWQVFKDSSASPLFKNQGDCVSFVATSGNNEPGQNQPNT